MDNILSFLADNYKWFMLAAVLLLFALIGFIVDGKKKKKNEEVVPVPNADAQAATTASAAPTTVSASAEPAAPAPAQTPAEEQGLVIEEPSLNNVEVTSNEVNIAGAEEEGSIFGTPEMQAPASVETTAEDPAITEGPTLVIEDKEEAAPEMSAPVQTESAPEVEAEPAPEMAAPEVAPEVAPTTPEVVVSEPAPEMAPTVPEAPVATALEVPAAPETPSAPTTPAQ